MTHITITDTVEYRSGHTEVISATVTNAGCIVHGMSSTDDVISWEQMVDVEQLSEMFADSPVRAFKVLVKILGTVYAHKDVYKLLT